MHSNCAEEVYYAGEFAIFKEKTNKEWEREGEDEGGHLKLIIDNNSGTYAPDKEKLPQLKAVFEENFPFLVVEAISFDDPVFREYKERFRVANESKCVEEWV